jgi:MYXO-CTERM domain-containing protein
VAVLAVVAMWFTVSTGTTVEPPPAVTGIAGVLAVAAGLPLAWRRRRPVVAVTVSVTALSLHTLLVGPSVPLVGWLAVWAIARHVPDLRAALRGAALTAGAVAAANVAASLLHHSVALTPVVVALTLAVFLAAAVARLQAARVASQRREREVARERAVAAERLRIARDLHDLVGHGLSTIAVQSSTARLALDAGDPASARRALAAVEGASRGALAEMRQMLGVLRQADDEVAPVPGLDRIDALERDAQAAGHAVTVDRTGQVDAVPAAAALTAYRVLQEAVTNAIRHAPGAPIAITLNASGDSLTVEVTDDGTGGDAGPEDGDRSSYGLLGLRERVAAAGGTLEAGPRGDASGWRVAARLPIREGTNQ